MQFASDTLRPARRCLSAVCFVLAVHVQAARADAPPVPAAALPATGQTESFAAHRNDDGADPVAVGDDGRVRAGAALSYRDNGDGTISDLVTGLVWEKKCSGCEGLHDVRARYRWSGDGEAQTVWDWLSRLNADGGRGFAGHSDWRIPNVTELLSVVDYGRANPMVNPEFAGGTCERGCVDATQPECSCAAPGEYWTSTTFADFPAHAYVVFFGIGLVNDRVKTNLHYVRAVRGGR